MKTHFKIMITLGVVLTSLCFAVEVKKETSTTRAPANTEIPVDSNVSVAKIKMSDGFYGERWVDQDHGVICYTTGTSANSNISCVKR